MSKLFTLRKMIALTIVLAIAGFSYYRHYEKTIIFRGVEGPIQKSVVPPPVDADWRAFHNDADSSLAIYLTDPSAAWLGIAHGLKSIGIPFSITNDYHDALRHKVVLVYPIISGKLLPEDALAALADFPLKGGTLIGSQVLGGGINDLFGFDDAVPAPLHTFLNFAHPAADADPLEKVVPIDDPQAGADALGGYSYTNAKAADVAALYEDGGTAIIDRHLPGGGRAIAIGFDLGSLLLKGYDNRQQNMARTYDNGYEPTLDVFLRYIEGIYRAGEDRAVTLRVVPDGEALAVIMTHDIDYTRSLKNAVEYARYEKSVGVRGTYFVQTKYIKDYSDDIILSRDSPGWLKEIRDLGMELASHTVAHSQEFRHFPIGDGAEAFPDYRPFVEDQENNTTGGTILGELRISRFLIEQLTGGVHVVSFRPGHLSNPYMLPQALVATDYLYSSSVTANDSLTHLPFQLLYGRESTAEVPIFEFPVTVEDEAPLLSSRLPSGGSVAQKVARHGGICVVLIHPNVLDPKLQFEKDFIAGVRRYSWFGALEDFGRWWAARNAVTVDAAWRQEQLSVHFKAPLAIDGLTINIPSGLKPVAGQSLIKNYQGDAVVLGKIEGDVNLLFTPSR